MQRSLHYYYREPFYGYLFIYFIYLFNITSCNIVSFLKQFRTLNISANNSRKHVIIIHLFSYLKILSTHMYFRAHSFRRTVTCSSLLLEYSNKPWQISSFVSSFIVHVLNGNLYSLSAPNSKFATKVDNGRVAKESGRHWPNSCRKADVIAATMAAMSGCDARNTTCLRRTTEALLIRSRRSHGPRHEESAKSRKTNIQSYPIKSLNIFGVTSLLQPRWWWLTSGLTGRTRLHLRLRSTMDTNLAPPAPGNNAC